MDFNWNGNLMGYLARVVAPADVTWCNPLPDYKLAVHYRGNYAIVDIRPLMSRADNVIPELECQLRAAKFLVGAV